MGKIIKYIPLKTAKSMKTVCRRNQFSLLYALTGLLIFCVSGTEAHNIDSLRAVLVEYKHDDTTKVNLLAKIAAAYKDVNSDSMIAIAGTGLSLADKIHFEGGRAECLKALGLSYLIKNEFKNSLKYYNDAEATYEKTGNKEGQCTALSGIALIYYRLNKYDISLGYFKKMLGIADSTGNYPQHATALIRIGYIYSDIGNTAEALNYALKGLKIYEKIDDKIGIAVCYRDIADVYSLRGDFTKAKEYVDKCLAIYGGGNDKQALVANYTAIGAIYGRIKDPVNAIAVFNKGYILADSLHNHYWMNVCLVNIGDIYFQEGNYDSAIVSYALGITEAEISKDNTGLAFDHMGLGAVYIKKGLIKNGITHLLLAYGIMSKNGMKREVATTANNLSEAYELTGDYKHALEYRKIASDTKDSLYNEHGDKRIQQLQFDYELGKKQTQIELLNKGKAIEQSNKEKQTAVMWGLVSALVLFIIIVVLLYRSRQQEKKNIEVVYKQKDILQQQAVRLEELNHFKDKTFSVLSHDLRGPLATLTTTMLLLDENVITPEEFGEIKPVVDKQLNSLNILLDNLLKWSKSYIMGETSTKPEQFSLHKIAAANIKLVDDATTQKNIIIHNNIPAGIKATADEGQIDIVIRNLISNALKFTKEGGNITIAAGSTDGKTTTTVADDGVGMTDGQLQKLFTTTVDNTTYGTQGEKGIGLGLLLCYEFIKANNGTITAASKINEGTTFTMVLPE